MHPLVIIPTYNERDNLPVIARRLLELPEVRVLVVDDESPDGTGDVADRLAAGSDRVSVLHRTGRRGLGLAYVEAMQHALRNTDATHICQMDADLSHDPADIPRLIAAAQQADVAIGSRYVPGGRIQNWPARRLLLSAFANRYTRAITRLQVNDCTGGFRCWRRSALERVRLDRITSNGYAFMVELMWDAVVAGCSVVEVPITFVERRHGASKLSWRVLIESALLPWRLAARPRTRHVRI